MVRSDTNPKHSQVWYAGALRQLSREPPQEPRKGQETKGKGKDGAGRSGSQDCRKDSGGQWTEGHRTLAGRRTEDPRAPSAHGLHCPPAGNKWLGARRAQCVLAGPEAEARGRAEAPFSEMRPRFLITSEELWPTVDEEIARWPSSGLDGGPRNDKVKSLPQERERVIILNSPKQKKRWRRKASGEASSSNGGSQHPAPQHHSYHRPPPAQEQASTSSSVNSKQVCL